LLPRGLLREPPSSLHRADFVILTRADRVSQTERERLLKEIRLHAPRAGYAEACTVPHELRDESRTSRPLADLQNQRVFGFAAIGNPEGFRRTVESLGCSVVGFKAFPDHHRYTVSDWKELVHAARAKSATMLICTGKDLVKIPSEPTERLPLRAVMADVQFLSGLPEFEQTLARVISPDINGVD
jgi:tetraacyldisaccharide 4'-kinase